MNLSLAVDCKTWPDHLNQDQIAKYLDTPGTAIVASSGIVLTDPRNHQVDAIFVVLPAVATALGTLIHNCKTRSVSGLGIVRVDTTLISLIHDELTDPELAASLASGWQIEVRLLPLERLPYDMDAPRWELADFILQTLLSFFVGRVSEFDVENICIASNGLWAFMQPSHNHLRERVRDELRTLRRTALRDWLARVDTGTQREERWRFTKQPSIRADVIGGFQRRHSKYVSVLRDEDRNPRPDDFVNIDPEQLILF